MAMIFNPNGVRMTATEIARWANKVHRQSGGKGNPFSSLDYVRSYRTGHTNRLKGNMCNCGVDPNGFSAGEFVLLPLNDTAVIEGGKAYMVCRKCGCHSHL